MEAFCQKNGLSYTLLNPLQAKKQLEEDTLRSWKTDKQDAHKLAQTHAEKRRTPKVVQEDIYQDLRDLSRFYQEVEEEIKRTRMHLHNCLQLVFPELEQFFSNQINQEEHLRKPGPQEGGRINRSGTGGLIQPLLKTVFTVKRQATMRKGSKTCSSKRRHSKAR